MYGEGMAQVGKAAQEVVGGFRLREGLEPEPRRQGQIEEQIVIGQKLAEGLHSAIQRLQGMIESVLRQDPARDEPKKEVVCCTTDLADRLREQNQKVAYATDRINDMIDRCEL